MNEQQQPQCTQCGATIRKGDRIAVILHHNRPPERLCPDCRPKD